MPTSVLNSALDWILKLMAKPQTWLIKAKSLHLQCVCVECTYYMHSNRPRSHSIIFDHIVLQLNRIPNKIHIT